MSSARVGGIYSYDMIISANEGLSALSAKNLTFNGIARLDGCNITGTVDFRGAIISGDLSCKNASFKNEGGDAFIARRMRVAQSFIWRKDPKATGTVILDGAHVAELDDNPSSWPEADHLRLDGFTYDRIAEYTSYNAARQKWLRNGSLVGEKFYPQPYTQYAKFLRDTGHDTEARRVLLAREVKLRKYERKELPLHKRIWRGLWDRLQWAVVGHGHAPFWSIGWLALLIFAAIVPAHLAWEEGDFAPNASPIIVSADWQAVHSTEANPAKVWSGDLEPANWRPKQFPTPWKLLAPGRDWETFNRYAYAADIVIPLINFGQTDAWAPSTTRGAAGWHLWWLRWVFTVLGWIVTALAAAAITGIIRRD